MSNVGGSRWLRFVAPSILLLTLGLAALPVIRIGVKGAPQDFDSWNAMRSAAGRPKGATDGTLVILTQNGIQSVWAGFSWGPELAEEKAQQRKSANSEVARKFRKQAEQRRKEFEARAKAMGATVTHSRPKTAGPAFLMILYFVLILGAAVIGYAMPCGKLRVLLFCSATGAAGACLGLQMLIGFPIAQTPPHDVQAMKRTFDGPPRFDQKTRAWQEGDRVKVFVDRLLWDNLAWVVLLAALCVACMEIVVAPVSPPKKGRRDTGRRPRTNRSERGRDDEDERNEQERPRRARRYPRTSGLE